MARRWTKKEEVCYRKELRNLYVRQNKSIREIGAILCISEKTVFQRLERLGIETQPKLKNNYLNKRKDIRLPKVYSANLAEFFGIMLGDGHISDFQVIVSLGDKEASYAKYVVLLIKKIFRATPKISIRKKGYRDVYLGSVDIVKWLRHEGLVSNKVKAQVDIPRFIFQDKSFMERFVRGFFDTDGSIYKLRYGIQISLNNRSAPLLVSLQKLLIRLQYTPSNVSSHKVYLTKRADIQKFFRDVRPKNKKHLKRYIKFTQCVDTQAVNGDGL